MEVPPAVKHSALALAPALGRPPRVMNATEDPLGGGLARHSSSREESVLAILGDDEATKRGV